VDFGFVGFSVDVEAIELWVHRMQIIHAG
jgi:hypothetical protein